MFEDIRNLTIKLLRAIMRWCASRYLAQAKLEIIGITGSVGKTSAKEAIWTVLEHGLGDKYLIRKSAGNLNNELGAPLAILGFDYVPTAAQWSTVILQSFWRSLFASKIKTKQILVLEMAADAPGDIQYLVSFIKPEIAIITAIGPAHLERFKTVENIAEEKGILARTLPANGWLIIPEEERCLKIAKQTKAKAIKISLTGVKIDQFAYRAAEEIGKIYNLNSKEIEAGLTKIEPIKGRMNVIEGNHHAKIIDSSYNSNPLSVALALKKLNHYAGIHKTARKIAVLGDMLDLGEATEAAHLEMASEARKASDVYIAVGDLSRHLDADYWFQDSCRAGEFLKNELKKDDIVLVKGSQDLRMERVVEQVMAEPERAGELLVRQSRRWKAIP